ncbi:type II toxin-antitoxin system CcdA family antitoxin [Paraburkholderia adhaesiva]|uniref:type II toxin-antitoxin system CcdA family antitoxin n=1 Tax=Paraburkholderia adhaesiva TaxID=2883244 RepID=UPI001F226639|nr:type II toxin-antitoxin system CcdA family antitoxin [Paraburkholderia adhaesiva]
MTTGKTDNATPAPAAGTTDAARQWTEENPEAIAYDNEYIEKNGLPRDGLSLPGNSPTARERTWLAENADAIRSSNDYVDEHGLPLARYRQF